eukprot:Opistho-2@9024
MSSPTAAFVPRADAMDDSVVALLFGIGASALSVVLVLLSAVIALIYRIFLRRTPPSTFRWALTVSPLILAVFVGVLTHIIPEAGDRLINGFTQPQNEFDISSIADDVRKFHNSLLIADLHADTMMWTHRDVTKRLDYGHVDIPRLIEGNVALQGFSAVTKVPFLMKFDNNDNNTDMFPFVSVPQQWPYPTLMSLKERAKFQAEQLYTLNRRSLGMFYTIKFREDLSEYLTMRERDSAITAGFLAIEGAHAFDGSLDSIDVLFDTGYRMVGPTHFFDNELGGSAHGLGHHGLTPFGVAAIKKMESLGIFIDIAHASPAMIDDIFAIATRPVVSSHSGVKGTCNNTRTLGDDALRHIKRTGGVVGIAYFDKATCGKDLDSIVKAIVYTVGVIGAKHVALGSDYDGAVKVPFDTSQLVRITDGLLKAGISREDVERVMGRNVIELFLKHLPSRKVSASARERATVEGFDDIPENDR